jgi:FdhE protein
VAHSEVQEAVQKLRKLADERPELARIANLYEALLRVLFAARPVAGISTDHAGAIKRLAEGVPLLRGVRIEVEDPEGIDRWCGICSVLAEFHRMESAGRLVDAARGGRIVPCELLQKVLNAGPGDLGGDSQRLGVDPALTGSVLRLWALPLLAPLAASLSSCWPRDSWPLGYCPVCGSWPLVAEFRGLEQLRWLRCGLCASGWRVDRIFCPFCGTRDHRHLQELYVEEQPQRMRVMVCARCRGFVPSVCTLTPLSAPGLLVAEIETSHLELIARERGYAIESPVAEKLDAQTAPQRRNR